MTMQIAGHTMGTDNSSCVMGCPRVGGPNGKPVNASPFVCGAYLIAGDIVGCSLDVEAKEISFSLNGRDLGCAFENVTFQGTKPSSKVDSLKR